MIDAQKQKPIAVVYDPGGLSKVWFPKEHPVMTEIVISDTKHALTYQGYDISEWDSSTTIKGFLYTFYFRGEDCGRENV